MDSFDDSISVSTSSPDSDEESFAEQVLDVWRGRTVELSCCIVDVDKSITHRVPLSSTSETEVRFINSFPNNESIN